jgi:hypothetical protein
MKLSPINAPRPAVIMKNGKRFRLTAKMRKMVRGFANALREGIERMERERMKAAILAHPLPPEQMELLTRIVAKFPQVKAEMAADAVESTQREQIVESKLEAA